MAELGLLKNVSLKDSIFLTIKLKAILREIEKELS